MEIATNDFEERINSSYNEPMYTDVNIGVEIVDGKEKSVLVYEGYAMNKEGNIEEINQKYYLKI